MTASGLPNQNALPFPGVRDFLDCKADQPYVQVPKSKEAAMTTTLTITAKGQVTLRKEILRHLGIAPGQKVEVDLLPNGRAELRAAKSPTSIENFFGCLHRPGTKPLTIEEIGEIAAQGWAGCR
jgi:antitoxin PrlF